MGNSGGTLKKHIETAEKTGALNFTEKGLEKFPPELTKVVSNLRNLDLSKNKIQQLPTSIGAFKMLKTLNMSKNRISSIPEDFENLVKLETLLFSHNLLTVIPDGLSKLKNLKEVNLSSNQLTSFPLCFCGLKHLNTINLSSNKITKIPDGVNKLEATELILNQNQISEISPDIAGCQRLRTLRLEENCLAVESIPPPLLATSSVSLLALEGNLFDMKKMDTIPGFEEYIKRYTAVKRKLD